jgi:hypothetical protein
VLGKRKLEGNDVVAIGDSKELNCYVFWKLRQGEWFNAWVIYAGMAISDKPPFVRYDYSIPLEQTGKNHSKPLCNWREKIDRWRSEIRSQSNGEEIPQVYFCPLNHNNKHFSLLEINELERKICHYDSMASENVRNCTIPINGTVQLTKVGKLVQVSIN